jgi:hypothetical protein
MGAPCVVLTVCADRATRRSPDGRRPVDNGTRAFGVAVHQIRASDSGSQRPTPRADQPAEHLLEVEELTVLTAWAEAAAEALAHAPERAVAALSEARAAAEWRYALGLPEPSERLDLALDSLVKAVHVVSQPDNTRTLEQLATTLRANLPGEEDLDELVHRVLLAMIEERGTRQPRQRE